MTMYKLAPNALRKLVIFDKLSVFFNFIKDNLQYILKPFI